MAPGSRREKKRSISPTQVEMNNNKKIEYIVIDSDEEVEIKKETKHAKEEEDDDVQILDDPVSLDEALEMIRQLKDQLQRILITFHPHIQFSFSP